MAKTKVKVKKPSGGVPSRSRPQTRMKPLAMSKARMIAHVNFRANGEPRKEGW